MQNLQKKNTILSTCELRIRKCIHIFLHLVKKKINTMHKSPLLHTALVKLSGHPAVQPGFLLRGTMEEKNRGIEMLHLGLGISLAFFQGTAILPEGNAPPPLPQ